MTAFCKARQVGSGKDIAIRGRLQRTLRDKLFCSLMQPVKQFIGVVFL